MRYAQLKAFHHVALHLGFSKAAKALDMTQPALSDQVRKLELEYDVLLFDRSRRQIKLTQMGSKLLELSRRLFECEENAQQFLSEGRDKRGSSLTIASEIGAPDVTMLRKFRDQFPKCNIRILNVPAGDANRALNNYEADIGLVGSRQKDTGVTNIQVGKSELVAIAAAGSDVSDRLSISEISQAELVMGEKGCRIRDKVEALLQEHQLAVLPSIEAPNREAVRDMVAEGGCIGFSTEHAIAKDSRIRPLHIKGKVPPVEDYVFCLNDRLNTNLISAFMQIAQDRGQGA